eukprot:GCRY01001838.1.p1 GENE.GCRY01001838.1~~GCRY01001838.1.p1  ORF type:complete len:484 (+),score=139.38 GCRY01001838.1:145-1596(+)
MEESSVNTKEKSEYNVENPIVSEENKEKNFELDTESINTTTGRVDDTFKHIKEEKLNPVESSQADENLSTVVNVSSNFSSSKDKDLSKIKAEENRPSETEKLVASNASENNSESAQQDEENETHVNEMDLDDNDNESEEEKDEDSQQEDEEEQDETFESSKKRGREEDHFPSPTSKKVRVVDIENLEREVHSVTGEVREKIQNRNRGAGDDDQYQHYAGEFPELFGPASTPSLRTSFFERISEFESSRDEKVNAARQWRDHQLLNINNMFENERDQAVQEYETAKRKLRDQVLVALHEKKKDLDELDSGRTSRRSKRTRENGPSHHTRKPKCPQISPLLKDGDILEDLHQIRKNMDVSVRYPAQSQLTPAEARALRSRDRQARAFSRQEEGIDIATALAPGPKDVCEVTFLPGRMLVNEVEYRKGSRVVVHSVQDNSATKATIHSIHSEAFPQVWLRRADGQTAKLHISLLRNAKLTIEHDCS